MHYSQDETRLTSNPEGDLLRVDAQGFVTADLVAKLLGGWGDDMPAGMLCDLRNVAGYGAGCATLVRDWLRGAHTAGVRRIAFLGSSAVLRTAAHLIAGGVKVDLRTFSEERDARYWLAGRDLPRPSRPAPQVEA